MPTKKKLTGPVVEETQIQCEKSDDRAPDRAKAFSFDIGREHILNKYWELANLDPEATKGNITGQLKALDSLREELGLAKGAQENEENSSREEIYRAAWMRPSLGNVLGNAPTGSA